jgi:hypothetical protein
MLLRDIRLTGLLLHGCNFRIDHLVLALFCCTSPPGQPFCRLIKGLSLIGCALAERSFLLTVFGNRLLERGMRSGGAIWLHPNHTT